MIRESVDILEVMKPVYNFKASGDDGPWKKKNRKAGEADGKNNSTKLHEIEEKEHGKILLAGQWILESEIAGLREKAGKLGEEKKVSWEKLNEIFLKEV